MRYPQPVVNVRRTLPSKGYRSVTSARYKKTVTISRRKLLAGAAAATALLIGVVFLGRGIAGFTPWWRRLAPEQPFARLDVRYYSPLCLLIGLGFAVLAITEFPT